MRFFSKKVSKPGPPNPFNEMIKEMYGEYLRAGVTEPYLLIDSMFPIHTKRTRYRKTVGRIKRLFNASH